MSENQIKLHLGCGNVYKDGWINFDIDSEVADLVQDLRDPLPYADETVDFIFAEHFIEHLTQADAKKLLQECFRVLKREGVLRLTTPSLYILLTNYLKGELNQWAEYWMPPTKAHMINQGMRNWGHEFIYDGDEIARFLIECGFQKIVFENWRESQHEALKGIEHRNYHYEIMVEATKANDDSDETLIIMDKLRSSELEWAKSLNDNLLLENKELAISLQKQKEEFDAKYLIQENKNIIYANDLRKALTDATISISEYKKNIDDLTLHINNQEQFIKELQNYISQIEDNRNN